MTEIFADSLTDFLHESGDFESRPSRDQVYGLVWMLLRYYLDQRMAANQIAETGKTKYSDGRIRAHGVLTAFGQSVHEQSFDSSRRALRN